MRSELRLCGKCVRFVDGEGGGGKRRDGYYACATTATAAANAGSTVDFLG